MWASGVMDDINSAVVETISASVAASGTASLITSSTSSASVSAFAVTGAFCCLFRILCLIAGCQHRQQQDKQPKCVPFSHGILLMFLIFSRNLSVPDFVPVFFSSALFLFLCFFEIPTIHFENLLYK